MSEVGAYRPITSTTTELAFVFDRLCISGATKVHDVLRWTYLKSSVARQSYEISCVLALTATHSPC